MNAPVELMAQQIRELSLGLALGGEANQALAAPAPSGNRSYVLRAFPSGDLIGSGIITIHYRGKKASWTTSPSQQ